MGNYITYLRFRGDLNFKNSPFNDIDAMLLSQIAGLEFLDLLDAPATLKEYSLIYREKKFKDRKLGSANIKEQILILMGDSVRFGDIVVNDYVTDINEEESKTFYGVTYKLARNRLFVAFRGTDGSLLSWKENFHTLYNFPTPGQTSAKAYLDKVLARPFAKVIVGGHSKGGNLAVYAAMFSTNKFKKKIETVYSFDGPGYMVDITTFPEYDMIKDKIVSYIPSSCVVGRLMNPPYKQIPVKSDAKGMFQHSMATWGVSGFELVSQKAVDVSIKNTSEKLNNWIYKIPKDEMGRLVDELFAVFYNNGILHADQLVKLDAKTIFKMIRSATRLSPENREFLVIIFKEIMSSK